ncbi:hypothetical protein E8E13_005448 [Curvularia kusanoi]|uniref:Peptidase A1 domain-containing protein n=1 Tax=Curvularia kusanoi TaxID=90978 RepID=A0A9P4TB32_CURKU|nr:hypothetical protein E8E13_005448 [Curvularia kusanoi]
MGSPEQELSFTLSAARANTYVYGAEGFCSNKPNSCFVGHGGQYNKSLSLTARDSDPPIAPFADAGVDSNWTSDSVALGNGDTVRQFSFGTPNYQLSEPGSNPQAFIGVAVNSTFINALRKAKTISSNAYSLLWGDGFADEPRDGSFTLGGYDESIMGDPKVTKVITQQQVGCPEGMIVEVTGLSLNHEGGHTDNLLEDLGSLKVCIVPTLRAVMQLPKAYGDGLIAKMGAVRLDNGTNVYGATSPRLLPYTPLLDPDSAQNLQRTLLLTRKGDPYLDGQGVTQYNASRVGLTVLSMDSKDQMARLGGMFFSSAYLMVNHDKGEFTIASARNDATKELLVGVDTDNNCFAYLNGTVPGNAIPSPSPSDPQDSQDSASPLSTGAIVGIAVGVGAAVIVLAVVAFLLWRRRKSRRDVPTPQHTVLAAEPGKDRYIFERRGSEVLEAPAQGGVMKMSDDERDYAVELDGNSQPSELPNHTPMVPR